MVTINRRRLLATATSFAIGASLCRTGLGRWPNWTNDCHPFSPARTVVLPRRLGRRHRPARRAIEQQILELSRICDGLRCDMAMLVTNEVFKRTWGARVSPPIDPTLLPEFWATTIENVRRERADFVFMAEVYWDMEPQLQAMGFDHCPDRRGHRIPGRAAGIRDDGSGQRRRLGDGVEQAAGDRSRRGDVGAEAQRATPLA